MTWRPPRTHPILRAVRDALREPAVLAVSGGADSTGLALLAATCGVGFLVPPVVVWVDHRVRPGSEGDGGVASQTAVRLGLPFEAITLPAATPPPGRSFEDWLRERRLDALAAVALEHGRSAVLTGHTQDDQIETILLRLLAGPGGRGWHGMTDRRTHRTAHGDIDIVHPLLGLPRETLRDWVQAAGLTFVEDPTNADTALLRNRVRHDVLPVLEQVNAGWRTTLLRAAEQAAADARVVDTLADEATGAAVNTRDDGSLSLRVDVLRVLPRPVSSRIVLAAITPLVAASGRDLRDLSSERIDAVLQLLHAETNKMVQLPGGIVARRIRDAIVVAASSVGASIRDGTAPPRI